MSTLISIIIPTYNRLSTLPRALDSVFAQTYPEIEVIVVDDGSTDATVTVIPRQYPAVKIIRQANQGVSAARNQGIKQAQGQYIALLDSDDSWQPEKLNLQLQALEQQPEYMLCHTDEVWYRHNKRVNPIQKHQKLGGWVYLENLNECLISPSSVLFNQRLFNDVGYFNESLPACEDYDLWLRISSQQPVLYLDKPLTIKYGGHADQLSTQFWGMDRFRIQALVNMLGHDNLRDDYRQATRNILEKKITIYLNGARKRNKRQDIDYYEQLLQQHCQTSEA